MKKCIVAFVFLMGMIAIANAQNENDTFAISLPGEEYEDDDFWGDYEELSYENIPIDSSLLKATRWMISERCGNLSHTEFSEWNGAIETINDSWVDLRYALCLTSVDNIRNCRRITWLPRIVICDREERVVWSYSVAIPMSVKALYNARQRNDEFIYVVDSTSFIIIGRMERGKKDMIHDEELTKQKIECDAEVYTAIVDGGLLLFCNIPRKDMEMVCSSFMTLVGYKRLK